MYTIYNEYPVLPNKPEANVASHTVNNEAIFMVWIFNCVLGQKKTHIN